jgi:protein-S-isoprenylcysteine O-methyltransferase Ste14
MGILAIDPFSVAYSRVALVESLPVAMMTLAVVLAAPGRRCRMLRDVGAGAVGMGAALCKFNALVFTPILVLGVAGWCFVDEEDEAGRALASAIRRSANLVAGAGAVGLVWLFAIILPNLEGWLFEVSRQAAQNVVPRGPYLLTRHFAFGVFSEPDGGVRAGTFLRLSLLPLLPALVWAMQSAARGIRQGPVAVIRTWTFAELMAAVWVMVEVAVLSVTAAPDRRHLLLTVPCAILAAHALGHPARAGRTVSEFMPSSAERWRARGLGAAAAALLAIYLRPPLASALAPVAGSIQVGFESGLSSGTLCAIPVITLCALGFLLGPVAARAVRGTRLRWGTIALGFALFAGASAGIRLAQEVTNRSYELRRVSNEIRAIVGEKAAVAGRAVNTLLFDAPNRTLVVHDRSMYGFGVYGLAHLEEVNPRFLIFDRAIDPGEIPERTEHTFRGRRRAIASSTRIIRGVHRMVGAEDQPLEFTLVRLSDAP